MGTKNAWVKALKDLRGSKDDLRWGHAAFMELANAGVPFAVREIELDAVAAQCHSSGEGPLAVYGEPADWGRARAEELREEGVQFVVPPSATKHAGLFGMGWLAVGAAVMMALMFEHKLAQTPWSVILVLAPLFFGGVCSLLGWVATAFRGRHSKLFGGIGVVVVALLASLLTVLVVEHQPTSSAGTHTWWWAVIAGYIVLAVVLSWIDFHVLDKEVPASPVTDEQWLAQARGVLLTRGDMLDAEINSALDEAVGFAAQSGSTLYGEFGEPASFSTAMPKSRARTWRNLCFFSGFWAVWVVALVLDPAHAFTCWWAVGLVLCSLVCAGMWCWSAHKAKARRN